MTDTEDDQFDAERREEGRRFATLDGQPVILRPLTLTVTDEEAEMLGRGEMPESILRRAARQALEDAAIMALEDEL